MLWITRPGSAPMYVRRWPRISASSWMPPRLMRTNLRPMARAMLLPRLVLPTPGGPTKSRIGRADLLGQLAHGHVLEDPLLGLLEAVVVLVEDLLGLVEVEVVIGLDAPRQADEPVDVGADDALLRAGARDPARVDRPP